MKHNSFGGLLFSGPDDALSRLAGAAESEGLELVSFDLGDNFICLCLAPEYSFGTKGMALFNRAQTGEFGELSVGLFGGTIQPQN